MLLPNTLGTYYTELVPKFTRDKLIYIYRPHYDDSVRDPMTGAKSEWTLLIYLTGAEDGVEGGEVSFIF